MKWFRYCSGNKFALIDLEKVAMIDFYSSDGREHARLWMNTGGDRLADVAEIEGDDLERLKRIIEPDVAD